MDGNIYDILIEEYGMTPEQIDSLMEAGVLVGESQTIVPRQQLLAEELRGARFPRGRQAGGVYTAADPLEHAAYGLERIGGFWQENEARKRQEEILRGLAGKRGAYLRGMTRQAPVSAPAPTPTGNPAWTMNQKY